MFNKERFAAVLQKALGDREKQEYADESGVNRTYISKYINKKLDNPPSVVIIKALAAKAHNRITYEDLMIAAGHLFRVTEANPLCEIPIGPTRRIPILGIIRAGEPIFAEQNIIGWEEVSIVKINNTEHFFLVVQGDSMSNAGILPGHKLLIRQQETVENGEIAVVLVNGEEATLKRVKYVGNTIHLCPENPNHQTQIYKPEEVQILGKVVKGEYVPK